MRFHLVDRIVDVQPGRSIRVMKQLTLGEEYLAGHFPGFPVMPGVLMLQVLVEAASWLVRVSEDFRQSTIVLRETKNVKYGTFMEPGRRMVATAEWVARDDQTATFKGKGEVGGVSTVQARLTLACYNLADRQPAWSALDQRLIGGFRERYALLSAGIGGASGRGGSNPQEGRGEA